MLFFANTKNRTISPTRLTVSLPRTLSIGETVHFCALFTLVFVI